MANRIRLSPGTYLALTAVTVCVMHDRTEKTYSTYPAGSTFVIPEHVNGYWSAAVYHPDYGDTRPQFSLVAEAARA